jgi:hypothetical protein
MPEIIAQKILDLDVHDLVGLLKMLKMTNPDAFDSIKEVLEDVL